MLKKLFSRFFKRKRPIKKCRVIPRAQHNISRELIDPNALKVLYRLHRAGFQAYLVGGCIRDCLLGLHPKDFDIATDANPDQIKKLFVNCRLIGRRFRLAHIHFGRSIIEVATFRAHHVTSVSHNDLGMIVRDNVYGTIEEDVLRRDFTINALYYNIADFSLVDFVDAMDHIRERQLVMIGDPNLRYREDPVRMLRAIRFAAKLNFTINDATAQPIAILGNLLVNIPPARIFEEFCKLFLYGHALTTYHLLCKYQLFTHLFPMLSNASPNNTFIEAALQNTDLRVAEGKSVTPSFLLAVFNWQPLLEQIKHFRDLPTAADKLLRQQQHIMAVPRRILALVRDVWFMQWRLQRRRNATVVAKLHASSKFRAGYDFLLLRARAGDQECQDLARWWQDYVATDEQGRCELVATLNKTARRERKRKGRVQPKSDVNG